MNRNVLKIIAVVSMLIDHIGGYLFNNNIVCRVIGRLAFPIFAFFIAEGMKYTRNRKKYILTLLVFAVISQIPYTLLRETFKLNILFTFLISISLILLVEKLRTFNVGESFFKTLGILLLLISIFICCVIFGDVLGYIDYSTLGVLLIVVFYFAKSPLRLILGSIIIVLMPLKTVLFNGFSFVNFHQIFALISILMLFIYNNKKGKFNLKYFFYIFYPSHLMVLWVITLLI